MWPARPAAAAVLDVGYGDGFLAARLARRVPLVVAIDIDAPVLGRYPGSAVAPGPAGTARRNASHRRFARTEWRDWPWGPPAFISLGAASRLHGKWEHTAPQAWPPRDTFCRLGQAAREILPGARIRHLLANRSLVHIGDYLKH